MSCECKYDATFFFNEPATTEIYPLSLHVALPILVITLEAARWAEQDLAVPPPRWKDRIAGPNSAGENSPEEASPVSSAVATVDEEPETDPAEEAAAESVDEAEDAGGEE